MVKFIIISYVYKTPNRHLTKGIFGSVQDHFT